MAIAGAALNWLRDNLQLLNETKESGTNIIQESALKPDLLLQFHPFIFQNQEEISLTVKDTGDVYFVPAFSGLFAPHWRSDARGWTHFETAHSLTISIEILLIQSLFWIKFAIDW